MRTAVYIVLAFLTLLSTKPAIGAIQCISSVDLAGDPHESIDVVTLNMCAADGRSGTLKVFSVKKFEIHDSIWQLLNDTSLQPQTSLSVTVESMIVASDTARNFRLIDRANHSYIGHLRLVDAHNGHLTLAMPDEPVQAYPLVCK